MNKRSSIFRSLDQIATKDVNKEKKTLFVKKLSLDLDKPHLDIIEARFKDIGIRGSQRMIIWEALELLAEKHGISWTKEDN